MRERKDIKSWFDSVRYFLTGQHRIPRKFNLEIFLPFSEPLAMTFEDFKHKLPNPGLYLLTKHSPPLLLPWTGWEFQGWRFEGIILSKPPRRFQTIEAKLVSSWVTLFLTFGLPLFVAIQIFPSSSPLLFIVTGIALFIWLYLFRNFDFWQIESRLIKARYFSRKRMGLLNQSNK